MVNLNLIKGLILSILVFNTFDAFLTTKYIIELLILEENNPLMLYLIRLDLGVLPFVLPKTFIVCAGCYLLWKRVENPLAQVGAYFCFIAYFTIVIHFYFFIIHLHQ